MHSSEWFEDDYCPFNSSERTVHDHLAEYFRADSASAKQVYIIAPFSKHECPHCVVCCSSTNSYLLAYFRGLRLAVLCKPDQKFNIFRFLREVKKLKKGIF